MPTKNELLHALHYGPLSLDGIPLDVWVERAVGGTAEFLEGYSRGRWGRWDGTRRRWYALPRPTMDLTEAARLAARCGLAWILEAGEPNRALVSGGGWWHARTPALALTRAIIASRMKEEDDG